MGKTSISEPVCVREIMSELSNRSRSRMCGSPRRIRLLSWCSEWNDMMAEIDFHGKAGSVFAAFIVRAFAFCLVPTSF